MGPSGISLVYVQLWETDAAATRDKVAVPIIVLYSAAILETSRLARAKATRKRDLQLESVYRSPVNIYPIP